MNINTTQFDWNHAKAFLATAKKGSFSEAAKQLKLSQPTLGRQVAALESALNVVLFERLGSGIELTPSGLKLLEHVEKMDEAAKAFSLAATGQSDSLEGSICITATEIMSAIALPKIIEKLRKKHPAIDIEIIASNSSSDLKRREADIALRAYRPTQPDLIIRKVHTCAGHLYGSKTYLSGLAQPITAASLSEAQYIGFDRSHAVIKALEQYGIKTTPANYPIIVENHLVHWAMVKQGLGLSPMTQEIGDAEPALARALPNAAPITFDMWLVAHRELKTNRKVRTVYDFLFEELQQFYRDAELRYP